jgi:hypothetical protein
LAVAVVPRNVGEGPCLNACDTGRPVLVPDLEDAAAADWPGYPPAALARGVRAVFAFPMQAGTARLGALDVYQEHSGALSGWAVARAVGFTEVALATILGSDAGAGHADEALARMRGFAFAENRSLALGEVAADILARRLFLEPD